LHHLQLIISYSTAFIRISNVNNTATLYLTDFMFYRRTCSFESNRLLPHNKNIIQIVMSFIYEDFNDVSISKDVGKCKVVPVFN